MKKFITLALCLIWSSMAWAESGKASYYTTKSCQREGTSGVWCAYGERFDEEAMTCARPDRKDRGAVFSVYCPETNKTIFVRCNDYGPGKEPRSRGVVIDLTPKAFKAFGVPLSKGVCAVEVQRVIE